MKTRKLEISCPLCRSGDVFYSCTPNCCFNHVCSGCGATFEPATTLRAGFAAEIEPPDPPPEAADPTVACARCESTAVYLSDDAGLVCAGCGARLALQITEIAAG